MVGVLVLVVLGIVAHQRPVDAKRVDGPRLRLEAGPVLVHVALEDASAVLDDRGVDDEHDHDRGAADDAPDGNPILWLG